MPIVDIKGVGRSKFPDDMDANNIREFLRNKYTQQVVAGQSDSDLLQNTSKYGAPTGSSVTPYEPSLMERASLGIGGALHDSGIISNKSGAYQVGKNVAAVGEMLPGVGDVADIDNFLRAKAEGDNLGMGLAALGVLPVGGDLAKKAGKKFERLYHGSPIEFDEFDPARVGDRLTSLGLGHYLTPNKSTAAEYGDNIMEFDVDTSDILDWQNLKPNQRDEIESKLMEAIPAPRIAGFGEKKFEVLPANKEGAKRFKELKEQTKDVYHHAARAKTLTDDEIIKNHPGLIDKIGLEDNVVEWREGGNLKGANDQQLMTLMNEYSPDLARHLGYKGSRFSDQVAIYDSKLATKINKTSQAPVDVASNINQQGVLNEELASATNQRPIQESIRIRGGIGLLDEQNRANQAFSREVNGTLKGLPVDIPGFTPRHSEDISNTAKNYVEGLGERYSPPSTYAKVDPERAGEIAKLYDSMPHNPSDPEVKEAYSAMIDEVEQQYQAAIDGGLKVEFIDFDKMGDPYNGSPRQATEDILNNNHMYVFSTRDGFGSSDAFDPIDNPMLKETSFEISGQKALANDLFRAVHDYFGHAKEGVGFRAAGEENAWRNHSAMFSKKARRALTTETRGQNNWLNFGPYGESNRSAQTSDTVFADQKIGLLPEWVSESFDDVSAATPYKKAINE